MPGLPFLNDNANRAYPFVDDGLPEMVYSGGGSVALPDDAIVEFVVIAGLDARFLEDTHRFYLYEILRQADRIYYTFRSDAPGLVGLDMTFCRGLDDPEFSTDIARLTLADAPSSLSGSLAPNCDENYLAEGWLTTGSLETISGLLSNGEYLRRADGSIWVEPAQVQSLYRGFLSTVNLANRDRTKAAPPTGCGSAGPDLGYVVETTCMAGPLRWKPGYNCTIRQSTTDNGITVAANLGGGEGFPCEEVPLFADEASPDEGALLTGGPACNEVIKAINGLEGPIVRFLAGVGVSIEASQGLPNTIVVDINLHGLALCPEESSSSSASSSASIGGA